MSRSAISTIEEESESPPATPVMGESEKPDAPAAAEPRVEGAGATEEAPTSTTPEESVEVTSTRGASLPSVLVTESGDDAILSSKSETITIDSSKMAVEQGPARRQSSLDRRKSRTSKAQISLHKDSLQRTGTRSSIMTHERDRLFSARAKSILAGSVLSVRRPSFEPERMKVAKYMNTYRLDSKNPFKPDVVTAIIKEVMTKELDDVRYDASAAPKIALGISAEIRARVKLQQYDRYKIVCVVDIGEKQMQSIYSAFRFLWDTERDFYAKFNYDNTSLFAVGCCFGIYRD